MRWRMAAMAIVLLSAAYITLTRLWHGSWERAAAASLAPALLALAAIGLAMLERRRARPLPRALSIAVLVTVAATGGALTSVLAPTLGSIRDGVFNGVLWGTIIALGWVRPRAPRWRPVRRR
jgi:hypothetical protein